MTLKTFKSYFTNSPKSVKLGAMMVLVSYCLYLGTMIVDTSIRVFDPSYPTGPTGFVLSGTLAIMLVLLAGMLFLGVKELSEWILTKL